VLRTLLACIDEYKPEDERGGKEGRGGVESSATAAWSTSRQKDWCSRGILGPIFTSYVPPAGTEKKGRREKKKRERGEEPPVGLRQIGAKIPSGKSPPSSATHKSCRSPIERKRGKEKEKEIGGTDFVWNSRSKGSQ